MHEPFDIRFLLKRIDSDFPKTVFSLTQKFCHSPCMHLSLSLVKVYTKVIDKNFSNNLTVNGVTTTPPMRSTLKEETLIIALQVGQQRTPNLVTSCMVTSSIHLTFTVKHFTVINELNLLVKANHLSSHFQFLSNSTYTLYY